MRHPRAVTCACLLALLSVLGSVAASADDAGIAIVPRVKTVSEQSVTSPILIVARSQQQPASSGEIEIVPRILRAGSTSGPALVTESQPAEGSAPAAEGSAPAAAPAPGCCPPNAANAADYTKVYNSIPFSRSEYDANPSYRQNSTMELLLGQLRPGVTNSYAAASAPPLPYSGGYGVPYRTFYGRYGVNFNLWWRRVPQFYYPYQFSYPPYYPQWSLPYPY